jgi:hypothetical protein
VTIVACSTQRLSRKIQLSKSHLLQRTSDSYRHRLHEIHTGSSSDKRIAFADLFARRKSARTVASTTIMAAFFDRLIDLFCRREASFRSGSFGFPDRVANSLPSNSNRVLPSVLNTRQFGDDL